MSSSAQDFVGARMNFQASVFQDICIDFFLAANQSVSVVQVLEQPFLSVLGEWCGNAFHCCLWNQNVEMMDELFS